MSGTVCGILDALHYSTVQADRNQATFKIIFAFFERMVAVGNAARIALQYGASGTGTDWYDGANPFGENAFAVYRFLASASSVRTTDFYVLIQWADTASFGTAPGNPGRLKGSTSGDGIGIQMAFREDGGSPWNGTTNNNGTDTKGATVWVAGGSVLHVLDRSCSDAVPNGSWVSTKDNLLPLCDTTADYGRFHCIGDADGFVIFTTATSSLGSPVSYWATYVGVYTPRDGFSMTNPYILVNWNTAIVVTLSGSGTTHGTYNCSTYYEGGALNNIPANKVQSYNLSTFDNLHNLTLQPNMQVVGGEYDRLPIIVIAYEGATKGLIGQIPEDILSTVFGLPMETTNAAKTIAYLGTTDIDGQQFVVPWDGGDAPGVNTVTRTWRTL